MQYFIEILSNQINQVADIFVRFKIDHGRINRSSGQVQLTLIKIDSLNLLRRLRIENYTTKIIRSGRNWTIPT